MKQTRRYSAVMSERAEDPAEGMTLDEVEAFCAEARKRGFDGATRLQHVRVNRRGRIKQLELFSENSHEAVQIRSRYGPSAEAPPQ